MNPKKRETRRFKEKDDAGPVINRSAVETPHFFREVGAFGVDAQRRSGDFSIVHKWRRS